MERRDVIKRIGLASVLGATGLLAAACTNDVLVPVPSPEKEDKPVEKEVVKSERDKLIVNRNRMSFADPANPTKAELKHTPAISFEKSDKDGFVKIDAVVGSDGIIHPATKEHWIDYLTFFVNDEQKVHLENQNGEIRGNGQFWYKLNVGDVVKIESGCNLHGIWENTKTFEG